MRGAERRSTLGVRGIAARSLSSILGADANVRLLRELARHGGQLSAPDLVRRSGLAKASVARGLRSLEATGVVAAAGTGRSVLYRLRADHPLSAALSLLFEAEERRFQSVLDSAGSAITSAGPGLVALWLFGSVARGEDRIGSDLDLLLVTEPGALSRLADALRDGLAAPAETLDFTPAVAALGTDDVVRLAAARDPWWTGIARDAVPLVGGYPQEVAATLTRAAGREVAV